MENFYRKPPMTVAQAAARQIRRFRHSLPPAMRTMRKVRDIEQRAHQVHRARKSAAPAVSVATLEKMGRAHTIAKLAEYVGEQPCATCGAKPGEPCVTKGGNIAKQNHVGRS